MLSNGVQHQGLQHPGNEQPSSWAKAQVAIGSLIAIAIGILNCLIAIGSLEKR
jgi:hypothetical protein